MSLGFIRSATLTEARPSSNSRRRAEAGRFLPVATGRPSASGAPGATHLSMREFKLDDIDIPGQKLNVRLSDQELAARAKTWQCPPARFETGYLAKYASMATSADTGAILKWD